MIARTDVEPNAGLRKPEPLYRLNREPRSICCLEHGARLVRLMLGLPPQSPCEEGVDDREGRGRRSTIVGVPPSAVPNFAKSLIVVARRGFSDAARRSIVRGVRNPARSQNARFSLEHRLAATFPGPGTGCPR